MDDRGLRVSDAEREHVGDLLQRAVGEGRLSIAEFTERMDVAMSARTRGELNAVLVDLPGVRAYGAAELAKPVSAGPPQVLRSTFGTTTRKGVWTVPAAVQVRNRFGNTTLDLTRAEITMRQVAVTIDDVCGTTTIVVPTGTAVDLDGVRATASSVNNSATLGGAAVELRLTVTGRVVMGNLTVRNSYGDKVRSFLR